MSFTLFLLPGIDKTVPPSNLKVDLSCTPRKQTDVLTINAEKFKKKSEKPNSKGETSQIHL